MNINSHLLGDLLVSMGMITRLQLDEALQAQLGFVDTVLPETDLDRTELVTQSRQKNRDAVPRLGQILINKGYLTEEQLAPALELQNMQARQLSLLSPEKLAIALQVGFVINSTIDLVDVLDLIMKYANIVTDAMASTLMLLDEKTGELVFSIPTGPNAEDLKDVRIPPGVGVAGWVAENERHVLVPDTRRDDRFYSQIDDMTGMETRSLLAVPMKSKRKLIGVLEVINKTDNGSFTEEDVLLLSVFSHHAAIAIENAMLFNSMQNRLEKEKLIEQKVSESERLRSIGTLAGGIAHDFNNILGAIIGYTELSCMEAQADSQQYSHLTKVLEASNRARELISQILTFSRQSEKESKPVQVNTVVQEAIKLLRASLPRSIEMKADISCKSVVMGDSTQIHQVVMNLCTNAAQAMKEGGGSLRISLEETELAGDGENGSAGSGPYLNLRVSDTGVGMTPHVAERIFEPFFTTKEKGQGTGMGLSVVHGIVKSHGGDIRLKTEPGKGTVFDVYFPVIYQDPEPRKEEPGETAPQGTEHILFVDDEIMLLDVAKKSLNSLGYRVTIETGSQEALERFVADPLQYDLVVTDMTMPRMNGDTMAAEMLRVRPDVPIIMCTGFNSGISEDTAMDRGFRAFLMKPVNGRQLAVTVRRVLDGLKKPA